MSVTSNDLYDSMNSMNDNKYNSQKASKSHKIKAILKPLLKFLKKNGANKKQSSQIYSDVSYDEYCMECDDNSNNEDLEEKILSEIEDCQPDSAIFICNDGEWNVAPVVKKQAFVPVHFARTNAGTFFWTSISTSADSDVSIPRHCYTECQDAAEQIPMFLTQDRWVQA